MKIFNVFPTTCRTEPEQVLKNKNDISTLKNDLITAKNDLATLKADVDNLKIDDDTFRQKIASLEASINNLTTSVNSQEEAIGILQETSQNNTNEISVLNNRMGVAEDSLTEQETTINLIKDGSIIVGEASKVKLIEKYILNENSTSDQVQEAIDSFVQYGKPIYFLNNDKYLLMTEFKDGDRIDFSNDFAFVFVNNIWKIFKLKTPIEIDLGLLRIEGSNHIMENLIEKQLYIVREITASNSHTLVVVSNKFNFLLTNDYAMLSQSYNALSSFSYGLDNFPKSSVLYNFEKIGDNVGIIFKYENGAYYTDYLKVFI